MPKIDTVLLNIINEGEHHFRANITLHYTKELGYWANIKGRNTRGYKTFNGIIRRHFADLLD
jgi:hypothetical protein